MNKYKGQITRMFEQGCGHWPQFHDDRGLIDGKYWNWDYTINFGRNTEIKNLKIWDEDDNLIYDDSWTFSKPKTTLFGYFPSPEEIKGEDWMKVMDYRTLRCEMETEEVLDALKDKK